MSDTLSLRAALLLASLCMAQPLAAQPADPGAAAAAPVVPGVVPRLSPASPLTAGTYAHRFGRLHDLRRLHGDTAPGSPQHRFGQPGSFGIPGHFIRPDRLGPYDRLSLPDHRID